ncbi:hypothetical protein FHX37_3291 [Haloactinospora alba]|uniref:Uncharacterized protein n=1 Tax=Haloactinospora alba TaxID=405555 RepID=A0A543NN82_9ACTN|nr:hypothetical protein [Haloactinospora alba]TQN33285.1 hypothetical protein FHX37_3291 [Haloactinospora alba]
MSAPVKLGVFLLGAALVLAAAFGVGRLVGPVYDDAADADATVGGRASLSAEELA